MTNLHGLTDSYWYRLRANIFLNLQIISLIPGQWVGDDLFMIPRYIKSLTPIIFSDHMTQELVAINLLLYQVRFEHNNPYPTDTGNVFWTAGTEKIIKRLLLTYFLWYLTDGCSSIILHLSHSSLVKHHVTMALLSQNFCSFLSSSKLCYPEFCIIRIKYIIPVRLKPLSGFWKFLLS